MLRGQVADLALVAVPVTHAGCTVKVVKRLLGPTLLAFLHDTIIANVHL